VAEPETPIVACDGSEVTPGATLVIFGAVRKDDGPLEANRVNVGRGDIAPPMRRRASLRGARSAPGITSS
jgi:hypothetical protein